jgi:hypothetical protein
VVIVGAFIVALGEGGRGTGARGHLTEPPKPVFTLKGAPRSHALIAG